VIRRACTAAVVLLASALARADDAPRLRPLTEATVPPPHAEEPARRLPAVVTVCQDAARGCWSEAGEHDCRSAVTPGATVFRVVIAADAPAALTACRTARAQ
jgi:hypothetical protein